jgi:hypothetical protein
MGNIQAQDAVCEVDVHIYNVSLQTGIFPDMMKKAKMKPRLKKETDRT